MNVIDRFRHEALFYDSVEDFLAGTVPFVLDGLAREERILVAVDPEKAQSLRAELGVDAGRVEFEDMEQLGRNPGRIIPVWRDFVADLETDGGARGIGEPVWPGRGPEAMVECEHHESLLNLAFDEGPPWWLLCPYDAGALEPEALEVARRTHPLLAEDGWTYSSDGYVDPLQGPSPLDAPLDPPVGEVEEVGFELEGLAPLRSFVGSIAESAGLGPVRKADLVLAVNELATNSLRHGGGAGSLRIWRDAGTLSCEVSDTGLIADPLVGRDRPTPAQSSGRGLWLVHQLCDLVQLRSGAGGTVVRVQMSLM